MLRAHHVVGAAVGLAGDHGQLWDGRLRVGVQQLGAVADDSAPFLRVPGRNPGTSQKVRIGMLKASQVRMKRDAFSEDSMSSTPASCAGWLPTTPTCFRRSAQSRPPCCARTLVHLENSPSSTTRRITSRMS